MGDNQRMSEHQEGSPADSEGATPPRSPFARPPGFEGSIGVGPPAQPPASPEQRFAGVPHGFAHSGTAEIPIADHPTAEFPAYQTSYEPPYGPPVQPWQLPAAYASPEIDELAYGRPRRRKPWILVAILVLALVAGGTTIGLTSTNSPSSSAPVANPNVPTPLGSANPTPGASPSPRASGNSASPSTPLPNVGLPTPPGLLAIGYHVYSSGLRQPADVAIDAAEQVQFKKDGLERIVGLRALTIGRLGDPSDDYDADISVLRFADAAGAKSELDYSNARNKADSGANTIPLPGFPQVTAFLNKDASGYSIGAFTTVGRYQVVLILGGLSPNAPANPTVLAAEAARVLRALLPEAAVIEPDTSTGGTGPQTPSQAPSPRALPVPSATASGIHA